MQAVVCKVDDLFEWATEILKQQELALQRTEQQYQKAKDKYEKSLWYKLFRTKYENTCEGDMSWIGSWDFYVHHNRINTAEQMLKTINYQKNIANEVINFDFYSDRYEQDFYRFIESKSNE